MGCRCCKMIQSYLFDPVQVPSPGYVNEVNSCKLDEDDTVKLKGKQSSEVLVHTNDLQGEGLKRTASRNRTAGPQEPWPHQGLLPQEDTGGGHCAEKTDGAINGIGPVAALPPTGDPGPHQGNWGSWASTSNSIHPAQPFLEEGGAGEQNCVLPGSEETRVIQNGDSRAPSKAEHPALEVQDHVLQIPAPDYPQLWGSAVDNVDHEEKDYLFQSHTEEEPQEETHPSVGEHGSNMPFSRKRSWDSLNEAVATEVLSVYFKEEDPAQPVPVVDSRNRWEDDLGSTGDGSGEMADEDAAVAEALAALEAATAGEDVDEAD
ncbi:uncharacterized protein C4orf19 homolog [Equus przewalskii]|uniref:Chromosome 3 C4orf19 homolog n=2 Tax=Equus TaxID=9789 RepID=A0A9L0RKH9_HORSE|nr:uncharacterized protein C4orf19 homolog [Equus caballus]XP_014594298.1 uncharacterized protein C4orf19 homolog [Equus caballus]XP_014594300.1 uncharacterized protein C4orf19 homolog [Equus caballus]XP_023494011.1 uncharacterized protein C4orf19 homolog [Equus caballus]XP_023494012.1 uncharacterized protein C4orf19 homolog [Equus caballus]